MEPIHVDPQHCILTRQYAVYTPPIHEMVEHIADWLDQQLPGGFIFGASRLGKSQAIKWYLEKVLTERFGSCIPMVIWNRRPEQLPSEAGFWHYLLLASKFEFTNPLKPAKKTEAVHQCLHRFIAIAKNAGKNFVVLLIDEAHEVTLKEWKWLVGLQNQLDYEGILLSVFSVGTHQLGHRYEYLASTGNAHIAARFMASHARFHGIRSVDELAYVLNGYDEDSEWPQGSGVSFLQHFAPGYFASGKRLSDSSDILWHALTELCPQSARRFSEFPMQHIAMAVEHLLKRLSKGEDWEKITSYESWLSGLAKNNFSDHMRIIATSG